MENGILKVNKNTNRKKTINNTKKRLKKLQIENLACLGSRDRVDGSQMEGPRFNPRVSKKLFTIS